MSNFSKSKSIKHLLRGCASLVNFDFGAIFASLRKQIPCYVFPVGRQRQNPPLKPRLGSNLTAAPAAFGKIRISQLGDSYRREIL